MKDTADKMDGDVAAERGERRQSGGEPNKRRSSAEKTKTRHKMKRRISYDDMDIEAFRRRNSSQREAATKKQSQCDLNVGVPKSKDRRKTASKRRSSAEKKDKEMAVSPDQPKSRRRRRPSIDDLGVLEYEKHSRRQSNESKFSAKSKDDMDIGRGKFTKKEVSSHRRRSNDKADTARRESKEEDAPSPEMRQSCEEKDAFRERDAPHKSSSERRTTRRRRPSVDDLGMLEYEKRSRRQSNESKYSRKSKDDLDVQENSHQGDRRKKRTMMDDSIVAVGESGERGKNAESLLSSKKIPAKIMSENLERFEELLSSQEAGKEKSSPKESESKRITRVNSEKPKRRSLDRSSQESDDRPKSTRMYSESRRSSHGSDEHRASSRRSMQNSSHEYKEEDEDDSSVQERPPDNSNHSPQKRPSLDEANKRDSSKKVRSDVGPNSIPESLGGIEPGSSHSNEETGVEKRGKRRRRHTEKIRRKTDISRRVMKSKSAAQVKNRSQGGNLARKRLSSKESSRRASHEKEQSRRRTAESSELQQTSSHDDGDAAEPKTEPGEATSEKSARPLVSARKSSRSGKSLSSIGPQPIPERKSSLWQRIKRRKWQCLCCLSLLIFVVLGTIIGLYVLKTYLGGSEDASSSSSGISDAPETAAVLGTGVPSSTPSVVPTEKASSMAPTSSPLGNVAIVVIVQLDSQPEETGFSLVTADRSTTYISRPVGSLSGKDNEVVMEVIDVLEGNELIFTVEDESGLCCTHGKGYYRVLAGTGDKKTTLISGEQSAQYEFTTGRQNALQIGGLDPNEYCKPCPDGKPDCGRCAWCNADKGFMPNTPFSYQCHSASRSIPKKCFTGDKRMQLHNQYVHAMAGCTNGFEARPQVQTTPDATLCVEEASCIKIFPFVEPNCDEELSNSVLVTESCQDVVGGLPFGYSWGVTAPRAKECSSFDDAWMESLSARCCVDGVAFCSMFSANGVDNSEEGSPTPMPADANLASSSPTKSNAPTWDGYPMTLLLQLDEFPEELGLSITSLDKRVVYLQRQQGYYKKRSEVVVEKIRIPEGIQAVLTITDQSGDGICCENGVGYFQLYSDQGSLILDEEGTFSSSVSKTFFVGDPETLPPTASTSPTVSTAPSFDRYPITIAIRLDQWSAETGISISSMDGRTAYAEWPTGSFSDQPSGLVIKQVYLPRDIEARLTVTDSGGDGFCCLYGEGYVRVYAGESAEDDTALIAAQSGEFKSTGVSIGFRVGPAPTSSPAMTPGPTASTTQAASTEPTSSSPPTIDAIQMSLVLQLDKFSAETAWSIDSLDGLTNFVSRPVGHYEEYQSQKVVETIYLPEGLEYRFTISDYMGDGTCCWAGNGWYALYEGEDVGDDSSLVFYGDGDFGIERAHDFVAGKKKTPAPTSSRIPSQLPSLMPSAVPSHSSPPTVTTYEVEFTIKLDNEASETGWEIRRVVADNDDALVIERRPGYYIGSDTLTIVEAIKLEAGDYQVEFLDTSGNGFCCSQGVGFYSLYSGGELLLFREGRFEHSYTETFSIGPSAAISKSAPMLRGSGYTPKRKREHADQEA